MEQYKAIFKERKVCVLVPTYNNEKTLKTVLSHVVAYTDDVIVVNDGSTDSTPGIINKFPQVNVVSYPLNRGKGYALRQGFEKAVELGYDYAISIDSDGQHFAADLPVFLDALSNYRDSIIIGERNMNQSSVPGKSSFGKNFSNFWFHFETGVRLNDTQSGYRLYPVKQLKDFRFLTNKFEFEIEVLVRSAWAGIPVKEVPVKVFYAEKGERVSHFRPFKDFTRISILNTVLVTITLLYIKPRDFVRSFARKNFWQNLHDKLFSKDESDFVKSASVGFGIFMGIFPIWGFQLLVAIPMAFLLRLNKALVIIAANISIPPMIPVILFLSHVTGAVWMGDRAARITFDGMITLETLRNSFQQYLLGAVTLSVLSGVAFGLVTYIMLRLFKRRIRV